MSQRQISVHARPHPGPLPRGEGELDHVPGSFGRRGCIFRPVEVCGETREQLKPARLAQERRTSLPLLGERAGVRADVQPFS